MIAVELDENARLLEAVERARARQAQRNAGELDAEVVGAVLARIVADLRRRAGTWTTAAENDHA